jgi:hypothetical protein
VAEDHDAERGAWRIVRARDALTSAMGSDREREARSNFYTAIVECSTTVARAYLSERKTGRRSECATCPPADAIADERRCPECPWRSAQ